MRLARNRRRGGERLGMPTLGLPVLGNTGGSTTSDTATIGRRAGGRRRATLGTGRLWISAIAIVALRFVYDIARTITDWSTLAEPMLVAVAWTVLLVAAGAVVAATRALGEHLPGWMFTLFAISVSLAIVLDLVASWGSDGFATTLTVATAATTSILLVATTRATWELIAFALVATAVTALASRWSAGSVVPTAEELFVLAQMLTPTIVFVTLVASFRTFVQVELDRSLVQGTVAAPRLAVGMLASEQLARLDLAAERLLSDVADGRIPVPLDAEQASRAASLATELRLHLLEGRKQTWLYHAISESGRLGRAVTVADPDSLAGLLDSGQRDGLLSVLWLLLDPRADRGAQRSVTVRIGPMQTLPEVTRLAVVPIVLTTTGVNRTRADPAIWAELQRIGQYWDSAEDGSLRIDIRCMTSGSGASG